MHLLRTRIKKDIICEFLPPENINSKKVIILCDGMPSLPSKKHIMFFFAEKGFWVFHPRYKGTWESHGEFLKNEPHKDILDVIDQLPKGFISLWDNVSYKINPEKILIIGSSFGGTAAILASQDPRVTFSIALSPVIDWTVESENEPLDWLFDFIKNAFGNAYRVSKKDWNKLKSGKFYNPISQINNLDGKKFYIIHAQDDDIVSYKPLIDFQEIIKCRATIKKSGGHLSLSKIITPQLQRWTQKYF